MRWNHKNKLALTALALVSALFLVYPAYAVITYNNANYGLGIPALDSYIYLTDDRTFSTAHRSGNYWVLDSYRFSVENGNATVNTLFDSINMVECTVHGTADQESTLIVDASEYGYTHEPSSIVYSGKASNIYYEMTESELQLYATHETTGTLEYEITWTGESTGGGGYTSPPETPPSTEPQNEVPEGEPSTEEPSTIISEKTENEDYSAILLVGIAALVAFLVLTRISTRDKIIKRKRSKKPDYSKRKT